MKSVNYVLSTHWDREWHQSFQDFRYRLVNLLDRTIALLQKGQLEGPFFGDGQVIIFDDYLEIRPEKKNALQILASNGTLRMGPWYVMPDEFLVSGESLIRNIEYGHKKAFEFGATPTPVAYICDIFGHASQIPQIFNGFNIPFGFIWRGVNLQDKRHAKWVGPDGSELLCYVGSYADFAIQARDGFKFSSHLDEKTFIELFEKFYERERKATEIDQVLLFDGADHLEVDMSIYNFLKKYLSSKDEDGINFHVGLEEYFQNVKKQRDKITTEFHGELREPGKFLGDTQWLIPGVLSSRIWIKQRNSFCQTLLTSWAETFPAFATCMLNEPYPSEYLQTAWKWLLQNHPHDSICGCSIDTVHEDMKFRFSQCEQIGKRLTTESLLAITLAADTESIDDSTLKMTIANPTQNNYNGPVECLIEVPDSWPCFQEFFGFERIPSFRIFTPEGQELAYQRTGQSLTRFGAALSPYKFPGFKVKHQIKIVLDLDIPAVGYITLLIKKGENGYVRHPVKPSLRSSISSMSNGIINCVIESNGTLTITDLRTQEVYKNLLTFEDNADIGDGWFHGVAANDTFGYTSSNVSEIELLNDGPLLTRYKISSVMRIPKEFNFSDGKRSSEYVNVRIENIVTLKSKCDYVEIETTIENCANDHRMRVLFPSSAETDHFYTDSLFDIIKRDIKLPEDNYKYRELDVETRPQQSWVSVYDGTRGLAIISSGLPECACLDLPEHPIALTLFRGTRRTVFTNGEPNGQLQGTLKFNYWIKPISKYNPIELCTLGNLVTSGFKNCIVSQDDFLWYDNKKKCPVSDSLVEVKGAVLSSLRMVQNNLQIRLFNPLDIEAKCTCQFSLSCDVQFVSAIMVDLLGNQIGDVLQISDGHLEFLIPAKKIVTFKII